jgi:hypothetical protein
VAGRDRDILVRAQRYPRITSAIVRPKTANRFRSCPEDRGMRNDNVKYAEG